MRPSVSACIIACNDESTIASCLASLEWADETVVVLDEKSRDDTEARALERGAMVLRHAYAGNVEQKNWALDRVSGDWVVALDADEALSEPLARELRGCLERDGDGCDGFEFNRLTRHLGRWIRHGDFHPDWQLRAFRRKPARWAGIDPHGRVHLAGSPSPRCARLEGDLLHESYADLAGQLERVQEFSRVQARELYRAGRRARWSDLCLRPPARFLRAYLLKGGFRDGVPGFLIAAITAFHVLLKYAKLWELERRGGDGDA